MSYFRLKCFSPKISHSLLLTLSILIGCWGLVHLAYTIILSIVRTKSLFLLSSTYCNGFYCYSISSSDVLTNESMIYYGIVGSLALILSVFLVLVLMDVIWKQKRNLYIKLIFLSLIVVLIMEFSAAVYSSLNLPVYQTFFRVQICSDGIFSILYDLFLRDPCNWFKLFLQFTKAQLIITWILIIPSISLMIYALAQKFLHTQNVQDLTNKFQEGFQYPGLSSIQLT